MSERPSTPGRLDFDAVARCFFRLPPGALAVVLPLLVVEAAAAAAVALDPVPAWP